MNPDVHKFEISIIDFYQTFGAFLDREENKGRYVRKFKPPLMRRNTPNFQFYMPDYKFLGDEMTINFEVTAKIKTNLKLNIIERDGSKLLLDDEEEEVHFVKFEAICSRVQIKLS